MSPDAAADGAVGADAAADGGAGESGSASAVIRCGGMTCNTPSKCCLPFDDGDAGCVRSEAVCGNESGELLCSDPSACRPGEVCCLNAERNAGQTGFLISTTYCSPASACPDGPLQHAACRLGGPSDQCAGGKTCKPYLSDTNGPQTLQVDHRGYATCQ